MGSLLHNMSAFGEVACAKSIKIVSTWRQGSHALLIRNNTYM